MCYHSGYCYEQMYRVIREREKETKWLISCGQWQIWRGERDEVWTEVRGFIVRQGHKDIWAWADTGAHVWVQALKQPWSLLISMNPHTIKSREDRAVENCPDPLQLTVTLGRHGPDPHLLKHSEEILHLSRVAQYSWPCSQRHGRTGPKGMRMGV